MSEPHKIVKHKLPKGWQLVPVTMTKEMIAAHAPHDAHDRAEIKHDYAVSLQNAPQHPGYE